MTATSPRHANAAAPALARPLHPGGGFTARLAELQKLARDADKAKTLAQQLTSKALAAKTAADTAAARYQAALREALGNQ